MRTSREVVGAILVTLMVSSCSHAVTTQSEAQARIESGTALNTKTGTYRLGDISVELTKVVRLPGDELGLRFAFHSDSPACCGVFPRVALEQDQPSEPGIYDVVILSSEVHADGMLNMRVSDGVRPTIPLTIDLRALGVASA